MTNREPNLKSGRMAAPRALAAIGGFAVLVILLFWMKPENLYLWVKAGHVVAVISWMAALLYLPRLFIYHVDATTGSVQSETFKVMERRLYRLIATPAMIFTWVFGLWLAWTGFGFQGGWLHAKILAVVLLSGVHGYLGSAVRRFAQDRNTRSARDWRIINEAPTVLMMVIVILVVVKPF